MKACAHHPFGRCLSIAVLIFVAEVSPVKRCDHAEGPNSVITSTDQVYACDSPFVMKADEEYSRIAPCCLLRDNSVSSPLALDTVRRGPSAASSGRVPPDIFDSFCLNFPRPPPPLPTISVHCSESVASIQTPIRQEARHFSLVSGRQDFRIRRRSLKGGKVLAYQQGARSGLHGASLRDVESARYRADRARAVRPI